MRASSEPCPNASSACACEPMASAMSAGAEPATILVPTSSAGCCSTGSPALLGSTSTQYSGTLISAGICEKEIGMGSYSCESCARVGWPLGRGRARGRGRAVRARVVWFLGALLDGHRLVLDAAVREAVERPLDRATGQEADAVRMPQVLAHLLVGGEDAHALE